MNEAITKKKYRSQGSYTERMRLKKIAKETMKITRQGYYELNGMRILMFTRTMAMGGTEKVVLQLCRALKGKAGFLGVMSHGGELESELDAMGVPRFEVPDITSKNLATFAEVSRELRRVVRENDVNIVHCHHRMAALYCRLVLPKWIRAVATAHNVFSG